MNQWFFLNSADIDPGVPKEWKNCGVSKNTHLLVIHTKLNKVKKHRGKKRKGQNM